eukprot:6171820-Pleurochrysis_carterae.AAC.3
MQNLLSKALLSALPPALLDKYLPEIRQERIRKSQRNCGGCWGACQAMRAPAAKRRPKVREQQERRQRYRHQRPLSKPRQHQPQPQQQATQQWPATPLPPS